MSIQSRDKPHLITDQYGRFRSACLISCTTPTVGAGDDGFLWIDIGVDGTPASPLFKCWDEEGQAWRLVGGGGSGAEVTLDADADTLLSVTDGELGLDAQAASLVFAGPATGGDAVPTFRTLGESDLPADVLMATEHTAIGDAAPHHAAVTLAADADELLGLSTQELTLDAQVANTVLAGPTSGGDADPTFRALVAADIPFLMQVNKTVTPAPDGVETVFTVAGSSYVTGTLLVSVNGQLQTGSVDFVETTPGSGTFTFQAGSIPATGDVIRAFFGLAPVPGLNDYICLQDQKAQNTGGGTFTAGAWQTRTLNTEVADDGGHCSLAANQFTLPAGTYRIQASAPAFNVNRHQCALYNVTDAAYVLYGTSEYAENYVSIQVANRSFLAGQFTITGAKAFELRHQCQATQATQGMGVEANFGTEVYSIVELWKVA